MLTRSRQAGAPRCGDYYYSEDHLYCIEHIYNDRLLIEDCASGELFDIPASYLYGLTPVRSQDARCETD
jgi:hypothetical protein